MAVQPRFGQVLLAHHGILTGYRGPRGGYRLAREPSGISVEDILRSIGNKEDDSDEIATADWPLLNELVPLAHRPSEKKRIADPTKRCNHHRRIVAVCCPELGEFIQ